VCAGGEAGSFVEQVLQRAAGFDGKDIHEGFHRGSAEIEPQPVRQCAQVVAAGEFQEGVEGLAVVGGAAAEPRFALGWGASDAWGALGPALEAGADEGVEGAVHIHVIRPFCV